jgi:hypothetical protein
VRAKRGKGESVIKGDLNSLSLYLLLRQEHEGKK